jgi:hypothetical protein
MLPPIPNYSSPHLKMEPALGHCGRIYWDLPCKRQIELPLQRDKRFNPQNRIKLRQAIALLAGLPIISAVNRRKAIGICALFKKSGLIWPLL